MNVADFFFYLFSAVMLVSAFMVISARNPVHSVLFLILAFVNASGLFVLMGAEFLAMLLIVVYVGAVAVLFLFVVMMLDVDFAELKQGFLQNLPIGILIGAAVFFELASVVGAWQIGPIALSHAPTPAPVGMTNTQALGRVLGCDAGERGVGRIFLGQNPAGLAAGGGGAGGDDQGAIGALQGGTESFNDAPIGFGVLDEL